MDKNYKLNCLYKINKIAKEYGRLKQAAYDSGKYAKCREYKNIQTQLYTLKALTIVQMAESGELITLERAIDDNGVLLNTFSDPDKRYTYHCISKNQEPSESEIITRKRAENNASNNIGLFYRPYCKYLRKFLDEKYQKIYDGLIEAQHYFTVLEKDVTNEFLYMVLQSGIHITKENSTFGKVILALYADDIRICSITIFLSDSSDLNVCFDEDTGLYYLDDWDYMYDCFYE